jgi:hypothetical protein
MAEKIGRSGQPTQKPGGLAGTTVANSGAATRVMAATAACAAPLGVEALFFANWGKATDTGLANAAGWY